MRLEQLRARVEEENAKRAIALQAWQKKLRAAGSALDLRQGPRAAAAQPALLNDAEESWRALRNVTDMPEAVRDWIEVRCEQSRLLLALWAARHNTPRTCSSRRCTSRWVPARRNSLRVLQHPL